MRDITESTKFFESAHKFIPNGVSSPMRSFSQVGGNPFMLESAKGSKIYDLNGNEYTDFLSGFGAIYLGHAREEIAEAVALQNQKGLVYGLSCAAEKELAEKIISSTSAIEQIRFVVSGSEAVMTALRIARAYTKRNLLVKFVGSYHGHADALLAQPKDDSAVEVKGSTNGVVESDVLLCEYNNTEQLEQLFSAHGEDIAAVVVEPIATNMGLVKPKNGFHQAIRDICDKNGSLFIYDEVVTGFRFRHGGVSEIFNVDPDLTTFGKIIGGGAPIGAYAGKEEFMRLVEIGNTVFQSGTFAANPISMVAGNAALDLMAKPGFYQGMENRGALLEKEIRSNFERLNIPYHFSRFGSLCGIAYRANSNDMRHYGEVKTQQYDVYRDVHLKMRDLGYLMAPSLEEPIFMNDAHTDQDISQFALNLSETIASVLKKNGTLVEQKDEELAV